MAKLIWALTRACCSDCRRHLATPGLKHNSLTNVSCLLSLFFFVRDCLQTSQQEEMPACLHRFKPVTCRSEGDLLFSLHSSAPSPKQHGGIGPKPLQGYFTSLWLSQPGLPRYIFFTKQWNTPQKAIFLVVSICQWQLFLLGNGSSIWWCST